MSKSYTGQWIGVSKLGFYIIVNLEQKNRVLTGHNSLHVKINIEGEPINYWTWQRFNASLVDDKTIAGELSSPVVCHHNGLALTKKELEELLELYSLALTKVTKFTGVFVGINKLKINWISELPSGELLPDNVVLKRERSKKSKVEHEEMNWNEFKEHVSKQKEGLIYRGQSEPWRLQTTYHRTGHADLLSYLDNNLPDVAHFINLISDKPYNLADEMQTGALLNLAQHHGYPTPLLDWTKSPYIAAFFAFEAEVSSKKNSKISIFKFDEEEWALLNGRSVLTKAPNLMVRTLKLSGIGNVRVMPQQSMLMYSNADNIEQVIALNEKHYNTTFLEAISIPTSEKETAMKDLKLMGITWSTVFPGIDGTCKQLAADHFSKL